MHSDNLGKTPFSVEERPMYYGSKAHCPCRPSMQPVEPLVGDPSENTDRVEFAGEQKDEGNLSYCDPGSSESDLLPLVGVHRIASLQYCVRP